MAFLHGPEVIELEDQPRPVTVVRSAVIFLVGTAVKGPVNKNVLIPGAPVLAAQTFGDISMGGTIPRALDGIFDVHGAVVIVCNVLDPEREDHLTDVAAAVLPVGRRKQVVTPHRGVQPETLVVKKADGTGSAYVQGTDYTYDADNGVIQILNGGAIPVDTASLSVAYTRVDPDKVTIDDIIGGVDADAGYTGLWNCLAAESDTGFSPKVLIAPFFTDLPNDVPGTANAATAEFLGLAERLRAVIIKDSEGGTDVKAIQDRDNWGSRRVYCVGPRVLVRRVGGSVPEPVSPRVAGLISKVHAEKGFWWSPSNQLLGAGVVGLSRPILFALGDQNSQANLLNEKEVAVVVRHEGFRLWGNRTCSDDPKYAFLSVVITNDIVAESLLRSHLWAIDRCMDKRYFEIVPEGVNSFLSTLQVQGAILGGECWVVAELNSVDSITQGHAWFDYDFTPPYPAERVTFRAHMSGRYIASIIPIASRAVLDPTVAA